MQKHMKKGLEEREIERDDAVVEIATDDVLVLQDAKEVMKKTDTGGPSSAPDGTLKDGKKKKNKKRMERRNQNKTEEQQEDDESEGNSEVEEQEASLKKGKKITAFEQRELVARAFAGDNVVRVSKLY